MAFYLIFYKNAYLCIKYNTMTALSIRKNKLFSVLALIEDEGIIAKIETIVAKEITVNNRLDKINKGIRKGVSLEQMKSEQNYKGTSYAKIQALAQQLDLQEPIESLLEEV
jgi:hypothetical protein